MGVFVLGILVHKGILTEEEARKIHLDMNGRNLEIELEDMVKIIKNALL